VRNSQAIIAQVGGSIQLIIFLYARRAYAAAVTFSRSTA
jgi:hypothetical protein